MVDAATSSFSPIPSPLPPVSPLACKSWTSLFPSDSDLSLSYIKPVMVDGVLQIPRSVVDKGLSRMRRCLVAQFLGAIPPIKVSSWVLSKGPWHVHSSLLHLRPWMYDIAPVEVEDDVAPVWIKMVGIPPPLFSKDGLSTVASLVGVPVQMDMQTHSVDGLGYAKTCVLIPVGADRVESVTIALDGAAPVSIGIEYVSAREYSKPKGRVIVVKEKAWRPVQQDAKAKQVASEPPSQLSSEREDASESPSQPDTPGPIGIGYVSDTSLEVEVASIPPAPPTIEACSSGSSPVKSDE
ncbi:hypothetical protein LINGRAHAP2_LOCUS18028, partial [Linum grandiflorum]